MLIVVTLMQYASTWSPYIDPQYRDDNYHYIHWGPIDEKCKFILALISIKRRHKRGQSLFSLKLGSDRGGTLLERHNARAITLFTQSITEAGDYTNLQGHMHPVQFADDGRRCLVVS